MHQLATALCTVGPACPGTAAKPPVVGRAAVCGAAHAERRLRPSGEDNHLLIQHLLAYAPSHPHPQ